MLMVEREAQCVHRKSSLSTHAAKPRVGGIGYGNVKLKLGRICPTCPTADDVGGRHRNVRGVPGKVASGPSPHDAASGFISRKPNIGQLSAVWGKGGDRNRQPQILRRRVKDYFSPGCRIGEQ